MSGLKMSAVNMAAERAAAAALCTEATRANCEAGALLAELEAAVKAGAAHREAFRGLLVELHKAHQDAEAACKLSGETLRKRWLKLADVQAARQASSSVLGRMGQLREQVQRARGGLGLQANLAALCARLEAQQEELQRWEGRRYTALRDEAQQTLQQANNDIRLGKSVQPAAKQAAALEGALNQVQQDVGQKLAQDQKRGYVIHALRDACAKLGYTLAPVPSSNPNEPVTLDVNTRTYGHILFELSLDAVLRSQSAQIPVVTCSDWVPRFTEAMRELGVELEMKYADTGKPVRVQKTAKPLPQQKRLKAGV